MAYIDRLRFWGGWWVRLTHPLTIIGKKDLTDKKVIYVCNHVSNWDCILFLANFKKLHPYFMYKQEFVNHKLFKKMLDKLGYISVDRGEADLGAIKKALTVLKNQNSLLLFPEGTRNKTEEFLPFKEGAVMLAIKTKTPIRPFYIKQPINKKGKVRGRAYLMVGEEYELNEYYDQKLTAELLQKATLELKNKVENLKSDFKQLLPQPKSLTNKNNGQN